MTDASACHVLCAKKLTDPPCLRSIAWAGCQSRDRKRKTRQIKTCLSEDFAFGMFVGGQDPRDSEAKKNGLSRNPLGSSE